MMINNYAEFIVERKLSSNSLAESSEDVGLPSTTKTDSRTYQDWFTIITNPKNASNSERVSQATFHRTKWATWMGRTPLFNTFITTYYMFTAHSNIRRFTRKTANNTFKGPLHFTQNNNSSLTVFSISSSLVKIDESSLSVVSLILLAGWSTTTTSSSSWLISSAGDFPTSLSYILREAAIILRIDIQAKM